MQVIGTTIGQEITAIEEIIKSTEKELAEIPDALRNASELVASCDARLAEIAHNIEQQRQSLKIASVRLHDAMVEYNDSVDYLDAAAGKTGENAAVHDLKVKKEVYDAARLNYQKEQQMFDQCMAKNEDLQQEYTAKRCEVQSFIDQTHKRRGSLQSAHNTALEKLSRLLYEQEQDRVVDAMRNVASAMQQLSVASHDLDVVVSDASTILDRWPDLQRSILCMVPYVDASTSILEAYRAFLEVLLQERDGCVIDPSLVSPDFHQLDMTTLLELTPADISAALASPVYVPSPARIEEKLRDVERLLEVYRDKHQ